MIHILRQTFCSLLAMRGAPARAIQELAGRADLTMTQRYMHLSPAALADAIRLLDRPGAKQEFGDVVETGSRTQKRSIDPGLKLAVRQGFEPWIQLLGRITV